MPKHAQTIFHLSSGCETKCQMQFRSHMPMHVYAIYQTREIGASLGVSASSLGMSGHLSPLIIEAPPSHFIRGSFAAT